MSDWTTTQTSGQADPLATFQGKPMLGTHPRGTFLGRVVIEMWETGSALDDSNKLSLSFEAVDGGHAAFLRRVTAALPGRIEKLPADIP